MSLSRERNDSLPSASATTRSPEANHPSSSIRAAVSLRIPVVARDPGRPAEPELARRPRRHRLAGRRVDDLRLHVRQREPARRRAGLGRVVRRAEAAEPERLRHAEAGHLHRVRQPRLHRPHPLRRADVRHDAQRGQVGRGEVGVLEHGQPDRLERGERDRAACRTRAAAAPYPARTVRSGPSPRRRPWPPRPRRSRRSGTSAAGSRTGRPGAGPSRSATASPSATSDAWSCRHPRGRLVVPDV